VAERLVHVDEALGGWTQEILLLLDLDGDDAATAVASLGELLSRNGQRAPAQAAEDGLQPVPLLVKTRRQGRSWLLRSRNRRMVLTLDSLRSLRSLPGSRGLRLRCILPPPVEARNRRQQAVRRQTVS
jgi:hypothetical protein